MIALAVDPSNKGYAYAVAQTHGPKFRLITSGDVTGTRRHQRDTLHALFATHTPDRYGVEDVAGYLSAARQNRQRTGAWDLSDLVDTAQTSGMLIAWAPNPDHVVLLPANGKGNQLSWRLILTRHARADDQAVAHALNYWLDGGLPVRSRNRHGQPLSYKINNHQRDALGLAVTLLLSRPDRSN